MEIVETWKNKENFKTIARGFRPRDPLLISTVSIGQRILENSWFDGCKFSQVVAVILELILMVMVVYGFLLSTRSVYQP